MRIVLVATSVAALLASAPAASAAGQTATGGVSPVRASSGAAVTASAVDTARAAAYDAYHQVFQPALAVPLGWNGSTQSCTPGAISPQAQQATLDTINYFRQMAGLAPVTFDSALSSHAQQAALMMDANNSISHNPPSTWTCYTQEGHDAAGASNLALGAAGANAIALYLDDPGNPQVGHRRWVLNPPARTMGSGSTDSTNALYVFGSTDESDQGPDWLPYPVAGDFPAQNEPSGQWSLSAPGDVDFSNASVTVTTKGQSLPVTLNDVDNGYGENTLVWHFDPGYQGGAADQAYDVTVSNILVNGVATSHSYTTTLFDATVDHRQTITFPAPADANVGAAQQLRATASSGLPVSYASTTPSVCTISGSTVTAQAVGTCTVTASQPGDANFSAAPSISRSFAVSAAQVPLAISGASTRTATYGQTVPISGTAPAGSTVGVWFHEAGSNGYIQRRTLTASSSGTWSTSFAPNNEYRFYATAGSAQTPSVLVQLAPTIAGPTSTVVPKGSTYTIRGTGIPRATLTIHFHKAGTAANDYSIVRTVTVGSNGSWSRPYVASVDYRFFASLPNGKVSPTILVQAR